MKQQLIFMLLTSNYRKPWRSQETKPRKVGMLSKNRIKSIAWRNIHTVCPIIWNLPSKAKVHQNDNRSELACHSFVDNVRPNVQIFEFGVAFVLRQDEYVLLYEIFLLLLFRFSRLEFFLNFFYDSERVVQIGRRRWQFARLFGIGTSVGAAISSVQYDIKWYRWGWELSRTVQESLEIMESLDFWCSTCFFLDKIFIRCQTRRNRYSHLF